MKRLLLLAIVLVTVLTAASGAVAGPVTRSCHTCTEAQLACKTACQLAGCKASFSCYTPDPCASFCECVRCVQ